LGNLGYFGGAFRSIRVRAERLVARLAQEAHPAQDLSALWIAAERELRPAARFTLSAGRRVAQIEHN
jgi:hypothetical protein